MKYGFVYITTNNENGMKFIGRHKGKSTERVARGMGVHYLNDVQTHGLEAFTTEIVAYAESANELMHMYDELMEKYNAKKSLTFYNCCDNIRVTSHKEKIKGVRCITDNKNFKNISEASQEYGLSKDTILHACNKEVVTTGRTNKKTWRYLYK